MSDISHNTAIKIKTLQHIITDKRFRELTGGLALEDLSQEIAAPLESHLRKLHEWYANIGNVTLEFIEESNKNRLHNPDGFVSGLTPRIVDLVSVAIWEQSKGA